MIVFSTKMDWDSVSNPKFFACGALLVTNLFYVASIFLVAGCRRTMKNLKDNLARYQFEVVGTLENIVLHTVTGPYWYPIGILTGILTAVGSLLVLGYL